MVLTLENMIVVEVVVVVVLLLAFAVFAFVRERFDASTNSLNFRHLA